MSKYNKEFYDAMVLDLDDRCKKLVEKIKDTKFFREPASTKYHHVYHGGLADHSIELFNKLCEYCDNDPEMNKFSRSDLFLVAVGHDLDKIGSYFYNYSEQTFSFIFRSRNGKTHGGNSAKLLIDYLGEDFKNTPNADEILIAIEGHMAEFDRMHAAKDFWNTNKANHKLMVYTSYSDLYSCGMDEKGQPLNK